MTGKRRIALAISTISLFSHAVAGHAQEKFSGGSLEVGRAKALQCVACHGTEGIAPNPMFPHLAGQNASYLEMQLEHFRSGDRFHEIMSPIAESLTDEDVSDLAAYFSSIGPLANAGGYYREPTGSASDQE